MKKNVHSRSIEKPTVEAIVKSLCAIQQAIALVVTPLTARERKTLLKMGEKSKAFVDKCHEFIQNNPEFCPNYFKLKEFTTDYEDAQGLYSAVNIAAQVLVNLQDTQMCAGSEAFQSALVYYNSVKKATFNNIPGAKPIYEELRKRFPHTRRRKTPAENTPLNNE